MILALLRHHAPAFALFVLLLVGACTDKKDTYVERPVEELYNAAMDNIDAGEYYKAAQAFDEVDRQHPYSVWATKAQLMGAYAMYERNKYDDAIIALDRFIQLHPGNRDVAYAYYLKGLCFYEQITDVGRDQKMTEQSLKTLQEVVDRFPTSPYARDAKLKIDLARDHVAGKEMAIGRYYLTIQQYLAALNRFKAVSEQYQTTTHVAEALHRMVEIYTILGLEGEAARTAAVLGHNFPGSDWYQDTYAMVEHGDMDPAKRKEREKSWLNFWSSDKPKPEEPKKEDPAKTSGGWFNWAKFW
ncbi:outer membrane protein assembly factor BamD [Paramagnetospirillum kuznetsovii]|uniref:Outer membrane protein assembly factor BamD n=1 Tax=Paramagnetospirillum kuznetsovii TaxID=2053833 RepID=A0A364P1Y0_9PROT|nr:outer membrane protein assembly factor BamD [Paramagnetospirillum kuznetsovii]RAU23167.1 outer membrane protein assembly factor BamD [Paramagnetospirillum kuznetsovii]